MEKQKQPDFLHGSIGKLLVSLAVPAIFAQLVNALYNIVDRIYLGHLGGESNNILAGVGICFPIILVISAFAQLVGQGGAPLTSIKMGAGKKEEAEKILSQCFTTLISLGLGLTVLFYIIKVPLLKMFGAKTAETLYYADQYLSIYLLGSIFVMISLGMNFFINSQGFAKIGMATVGIGATINIVLDPILIFGLGMGVRGAAVATVISQMVSAIWALKFLFGKKSTIKIRKKYGRPQWPIIGSAIALGFAPFIMQSTESLVQIAFNSSLAAYGGEMADAYISSMTILTSCMQLAFLPIQGITQGAQPIIGYNYGAGEYGRVCKATRLSIASCLTMSCFMWLMFLTFSHTIATFFTSSPQLQQLAGDKMVIFMFGVGIFGIQSSCQNAFIALGKARTAIFMALLRKIILLIPLVLVLPIFLGVDGAFWAEPVADILAASTTGIVFSFTYRKLKKKAKEKTGILAE